MVDWEVNSPVIPYKSEDTVLLYKENEIYCHNLLCTPILWEELAEEILFYLRFDVWCLVFEPRPYV